MMHDLVGTAVRRTAILVRKEIELSHKLGHKDHENLSGYTFLNDTVFALCLRDMFLWSGIVGVETMTCLNRI